MIDTQNKLPLKFQMGNTPLYWAILSFFLLGGIILIQIAGGNLYKEFYAFVGLIAMFSYCGLKFLYERFNQTIFIDSEKITSKKIFGNYTTLLWDDINNISLDSKSARFVIEGKGQFITISLKFKNWEKLLEILEDKIPDNKFDF